MPQNGGGPRTDLLVRPALQEVGKIKLGTKDFQNPRKTAGGKTWYPPKKLDHWLVTTTERDEKGELVEDAAVMKALEETPRDLEVVLPYDDPDLVFFTRFAARRSDRYACRSLQPVTDAGHAERWAEKRGGEVVWRDEPARVACPCKLLESGHCKPFGILRVLLPAAPTLGGFYVFRTGGWNSVRSIVSSLRFFATMTRGHLAGLRLILRVSPLTVEIPASGGGKRRQTVYTANLLYQGSTTDFLLAAGKTVEERRLLDAAFATERALPAPGVRAVEFAAAEEHALGEDREQILEDAEEFEPERQEGEPRPRDYRVILGGDRRYYVVDEDGVEVGSFGGVPADDYTAEEDMDGQILVYRSSGVPLDATFRRPLEDDEGGPTGDDIPFDRCPA